MIVGVIGSGAIGPDLAYGFLSALAREPGSKVYLVDIRAEALAAGAARIEGYLGKGVARGKISPSAARAMMQALVRTQRLEDLADCDYVLEAASEDLAVKRKILASLEAVVRPDCLIGFATSGIPRSQIAKEAAHPARCFVNHPFFPAWRALPIEVVESGDPVLGARMIATIEKLGKVPVRTADVECFAADDIFCNYISEAARIVEEGLATPAQVDAIVHGALGGGGPFNVMDLTRGNNLTAKCQRLMQSAATGTAWFAPPAILERQGDRPWHDRDNPGDARHDAALSGRVLDRILAVLLARTYFVVEQGICSALETQWLTRMALGFSDGLLDVGARLGAEKVRALLRAYADGRPGFVIPACVERGDLPLFRANVKVERDGAVGVIRVFRPEVKNALSRRTLTEIDDAMRELLGDSTVTAIVLTSHDGSFAGADIGELAALPDEAACERTCLDSHPIFARIEVATKPVISALDGPVMGGGAELAMACHARVVGRSLSLAQPEVNLGILPGYGGTQRLPRLIGIARAAEMIRTGRAVTAADACAWGWAHGEPSEDPLATAKDLARRAAAGEVTLARIDSSPMTVPDKLPRVDIGHRSLAIDAIVTDVLRRGLALPLAEGLRLEAAGFARCRATVDMDIGMKNFIQNGPRVTAAFLHE
jgi:enoyl-CoA hydratase/3-hydroxyacyl-CoA dehydrogenase